MEIPQLNKMNVSKKMAMAIAGAYFVKDIENITLAGIVAAILGIAIICQTVIDIAELKSSTPND